jgi:putative salt-induced outer membrane protein
MRLLVTALLLFPALCFAQYSNESELALVKTGGNSDVQTTNAKTTNLFKWDTNQFKTGGHYIYGETNNGVSARNWDVNGKYEREVSPHVSYYLGEVLEGNNFTGIKTRYNSDVGAKYYYVKTDLKNVFSELGYRYSIEDRFAPVENTYDNKGRFYNEINHKISETVQYKLWLEYIPNFTQSHDYLVNGEASLTSILTSILSLKVAYLGMYDNQPVSRGLKNYDYTTTTSLVAKF